MSIFKRKKKTPKEPLTIDNPAFGKIQYFGTWYTVDCFDLTLWGKKYPIRMNAFAEDENDPVTSEQEDACREFLKNLETYQKYVEEMIINTFHITDEEILRDVMEPESVWFSRDGRYGLAMSTSLENDYLEECGIGPDENFGIALCPERFVLSSSEEFLALLC